MDGWTDERKFYPVFYRTLSSSGPLPKKPGRGWPWGEEGLRWVGRVSEGVERALVRVGRASVGPWRALEGPWRP